jgi:hypothetical protein
MKLAYLLYIISGSFKKLNETKLIQRIEDRSQIKSRNEVKLNQMPTKLNQESESIKPKFEARNGTKLNQGSRPN